MRRHTLLAAASLGLTAQTLPAQHVDILAFDDDGRVSAGFIDADSGTTQTGARLFTETLDLIAPSLFGTTAPGFFSNSDFPLLPSSDLRFDAPAITHPHALLDYNLLYWDGTGAVDFGAPADGDTLQFRLSSAINVSVDGSPNGVAGFVIDGTSPDGILHKHISFSARGQGGTQPADGLYLASIRLTMPGLADSEPIFLLFNADFQRDAQNNIIFLGDAPRVDPDSEALAVAWIEQNLLAPALEGDLDADGFVGIADLNIVLGNWNRDVTPGDPLLGDASGDGFVGIEDLNTVLGNWNAGTLPGGSAAIPEPGTLAVLTTGGLLAIRRRP